ncbi:MAG: cache domain-containing protein [Sterolibacteriaceae bacterium MAG5]|nr:cache domain-containing protein [Candidatus Nitricoxidireducens bremensis]
MSDAQDTDARSRGLPPIPVRLRLLLMALLPMVVVLPAVLVLTLWWGGAQFDRLLISRVGSDLVTARQYFHRVIDRVGADVGRVGESAAFARALERAGREGPAALNDMLAARRDELGLDFLSWVDGRGRVVAASSAALLGDDADRWPVVREALDGRARTGIDIFRDTELERIGAALAKQARLELVVTPNAAPTRATAETRGMVIHAAAPIVDARGRPAGALVGGTLLNQNLAFVDNINDLVYTEGSLPEGSYGTATLFLEDVRIATNVRLFGDARALGTRVSQAVRDRVLGDGRTWLDRAFVVNNWYISAYEPVSDSFGRRVGMLYVGFLEKPFAETRRNAVLAIVALFALVALLATPLFLRWARSIFRPLERMNDTMSAVQAGDLDARTGVSGRDEIGRLARHFDELLDQLQDRNRQLQAWADELDRKVAARTHDLEEANRLLRAAQKQLAMSEKLAAIGEITAGVAHEINNPVAVIQGNLDLAREVLGPQALAVKDELALIDQQVGRINTIVTKLLQFARPTEFAGYMESVVPADVVADCLVLVRHLLGRARVAVVREDAASRCVTLNRNELQQVLINLMVNAIHAMPEGGTLTLRTRDQDEAGVAGVAVEVTDTGKGIPPEHLDRIFDAFFTTKTEQGTGLGLSISYTLVARYGGRIAVASEPGRGAAFTVWIPAEPAAA